MIDGGSKRYIESAPRKQLTMDLRANPRFRVTGAVMALAAALACSDDASNPVSPTAATPDTTAPPAVQDLELAYDSLANSLLFAWTAAGDDRAHES